ncbi:bacteriocin-associated integral membrane family protein [Nocardiopsis algeriensis]
MPNRILSFAYTACVAFAALIAFLLAATAEQTIYVLEDSDMVWITENDGTHDTDDVADAVQQIADDHGTAIGYTILDVNEPSSRAHMYLAVSDPESRYARWLEEGYPSFSRSFTVETHPITEFGEVGPNGSYLIFDAPQAQPVLREALADHGLREAPGIQVTQLWHYFTSGHLFNLAAVALLGTITAVGAGVLLASRDYAVMRLQGHSYASILRKDLVKVARLGAIVLPGAAAAVLAFLGLYNGWNQLGFYALLVLVFLAILAASCLAVHAAVLGLVHTTDILAALKGRLPVRSTVASIYLVRVPVLALTLVIVGSVALNAHNAREQRIGLEIYEQYGDTSRPALSSNYGWSDEKAVDNELGPWLRQVDTNGDMVLAVNTRTADLLPADPSTPGLPEADIPVLVVNDTYLAEQEVLSPSGERYGPGETVRVIAPDSASAHIDHLVEGMADSWLKLNSAPGRTFDIEVLPAADGQTLFTYGAQHFGRSQFLPLLHEPIVIALPNGQVMSDTSYVTHMSKRETVFPDPEVVEAFRADNPQASRYISMVETLTTKALQEHATTLNTLRSELFNLLGASVVLLLTAVAACIVHVRTRAQHIFARHISGWSFTATHRRLLTVEVLIAAAFTGWATWDTVTTLAALDDPALPMVPVEAMNTTGAEPFHAAGIALVSLSIILVTLVSFHRRIVREGASQA